MPQRCLLCGADDWTVLHELDAAFVDSLVFRGHRVPYTVARCRCGFVQVLQDVTDDLLTELYSAEYYEGRDGDGFVDYAGQERKYRARFGRRLARLERGMRPGRVLDVGCALGWFLAEAADRGWAAEGVEMSDHCRDFVAERFGLPVHVGRVERLALAGGYDMVTLWDTIEYVRDPRALVRVCRGLLAPGGRLAITTGNVRSWRSRLQGRRWALLRPPKHLTYFTPRTLRTLLQQEGMRVVDGWQELPERLPLPVKFAATQASADAADVFGVVARV